MWLMNKGWMLQAFLIVLASLLLHYIEAKIYKRLFSRLKKTRKTWDDALLYAIHRPLGALIWLLGISFAAEIVGEHAVDNIIFSIIPPVRKLAILFIFVWFLIRFIFYIENNILKKIKAKEYKALDRTTLHALCQIFRAAVIITAILIGLQLFGIPISGVIAFGGVGGLAVGFAAKDILANFLGGLMIYLDRPFSVGDWIRSPDKEIEGTVENIGWRLTRLRTFDKRLLFVPNGLLSSISIENPSRMTNRRIKETINLRYDDAAKVANILKDIEHMLHSHPDIDIEQTLMVNLIACASWSLDFMIYAFTKTTDWAEYRAIRQDVFLKMLEIVAKHKAECAFPTYTVHIPERVKTK